MERRCKIAYISENALLQCLTLAASVPNDVNVRVSLEDVPPGTQIIRRFYDPQRMAEAMILWNEAWPIVEGHEILSEIKTTHRYIKVKVADVFDDCTQPLSQSVGKFTLETYNENGVCLASHIFENPIQVGPGEEVSLAVTFTTQEYKDSQPEKDFNFIPSEKIQGVFITADEMNYLHKISEEVQSEEAKSWREKPSLS